MPYYTPNTTNCKKQQAGSAGSSTTSIYVDVDTNGTSTWVNRTPGCSAIPLRGGGSLSLSRSQLSGQDSGQVSVGTEVSGSTALWQPAGASGVLSLLPFLTNNQSHFANPYVVYSDDGIFSYQSAGVSVGTVTYYSPVAARMVVGRYDS